MAVRRQAVPDHFVSQESALRSDAQGTSVNIIP